MGKRKAAGRPAGAKHALDLHDQAITWLICAVLIFLPLVFSRISADQFDLAKLTIFRLLILAAVAVWSAKLLLRREPLIWSYREMLLLAFLALAALSTFTSIDFHTSLHGKYKRYEGLLTFITYFTAYFVALQTFRQKKQIQTLVETVSVVGGLVALYGIVQYLGLDPIAWSQTPFEARRGFSTFGNPDLLAGYLVLAFPCAIAAFFSAAHRRWLHGPAVFLLFLGLLTAFTRGGWLGAAIGAAVFALYVGNRLKSHGRRIAVFCGLFLVVFSTVFAYSSGGPGPSLGAKVKEGLNPGGRTAMVRTEIWKAGWAMIKDRPVLGQGPDTFRLASQRFETERYVKAVAGATVADNAHNYPLQMAAGVGPAAALLMYGFFFLWLARMAAVRGGLKTDAERMMVGGAAAAVAGYLATMLFGISVVGASSTFWLLMGAMAGYTEGIAPAYRRRALDVWPKQLSLALVSIVLTVTLASAASATLMYVGDVYFLRGLTTRDVENSRSQFASAAALYPGNGRIMAQLGQLHLRQAEMARTQGDAAGYTRYARQALDAFERASRVEPLEADYRIFLANAHLYLNENDRAIDVLEKIIERRAHSVPAHYLAGQTKSRLGRKIEAIEHHEKVLALAPMTPDISAILDRLYGEVGAETKPAGLAPETPGGGR
jgi:O-antigen ligase